MGDEWTQMLNGGSEGNTSSQVLSLVNNKRCNGASVKCWVEFVAGHP